MQLEYLGGTPEQPKTPQEQAEDARYQSVQDFAFFAANFGYRKADYLALTPTEKRFLIKAYEERVVADSTLLAAAVSNAVGNVLRKKGKPAHKLWRKHPKRSDTAERQHVTKIAEQIEAKEGKSWVAMVYQANGIRKKGGVAHA